MKTLRRYTNLASTVHILKTKTITLLNPAIWDDKNDAHFMQMYKKSKRYRALLALCFSQAPQQYHHWKIYAPGADGVRIKFEKEKLLSAFEEDPRIVKAAVRYGYISEFGDNSIEKYDLPFLKRKAFEDEEEYRLVYRDRAEHSESIAYEFDLDSIIEVTLSPWMPDELVESTVGVLKSIKGCGALQIRKSTLIENEKWKRIADRIVD